MALSRLFGSCFVSGAPAPVGALGRATVAASHPHHNACSPGLLHEPASPGLSFPSTPPPRSGELGQGEQERQQPAAAHQAAATAGAEASPSRQATMAHASPTCQGTDDASPADADQQGEAENAAGVAPVHRLVACLAVPRVSPPPADVGALLRQRRSNTRMQQHSSSNADGSLAAWGAGCGGCGSGDDEQAQALTSAEGMRCSFGGQSVVLQRCEVFDVTAAEEECCVVEALSGSFSKEDRKAEEHRRGVASPCGPLTSALFVTESSRRSVISALQHHGGSSSLLRSVQDSTSGWNLARSVVGLYRAAPLHSAAKNSSANTGALVDGSSSPLSALVNAAVGLGPAASLGGGVRARQSIPLARRTTAGEGRQAHGHGRSAPLESGQTLAAEQQRGSERGALTVSRWEWEFEEVKAASGLGPVAAAAEAAAASAAAAATAAAAFAALRQRRSKQGLALEGAAAGAKGEGATAAAPEAPKRWGLAFEEVSMPPSAKAYAGKVPAASAAREHPEASRVPVTVAGTTGLMVRRLPVKPLAAAEPAKVSTRSLVNQPW